DIPVSISNPDLENSEELLSIFPNPANDFITINSSSKIQRGSLQMFDFRGRKLKDILIDQNNKSVVVEDLPTGKFLIKLLDLENGLVSSKVLIIQR
ncbi:MAG: T9SS type A sorting domain-containing protein, partial [Bacteroidota bacterium]